ncbi:MAG TPA: hypothetical protein ENH70_02120 [Desulfobacteraceae bacterium]|nr:hypothetical protein [Desulfobacteraceae bacterium]
MKLSDYISFPISNLWSHKLRSLLTIFGVVIGIGALVSMISFGKGMQKNVTNAFKKWKRFRSPVSGTCSEKRTAPDIPWSMSGFLPLNSYHL